ncbi:hypothetical protein BF49_7069 [Bradyrhizobium sp.]|nr:hypothetical protein BF49_7069 [Bradyrhizobium sp.]
MRIGGLGSQAGGESESESQGYAFHGLWAFQSRLKVRNVVFAIVSAGASRIKTSLARVMLENLADHPPIPGGPTLIPAESARRYGCGAWSGQAMDRRSRQAPQHAATE